MRMKKLFALIGWFVFLAVPAAAEITCEQPEYSCYDTETAKAGGIKLASYCSREAGTQQCTDSSPLNQCTKVAASVKCTRTSKTCIDQRNGKCRQWRFNYSCLNEDGNMKPAKLIETEFGPVQEEIVNKCQSLENNERCGLAETVDTEGAEIRDINRKSFSRSWWKRKRIYSCLAPGEGENTCGPLESDPTCVRKKKTCLATLDGECSNWEYHYRCGQKTGKLKTSCEPVNVCVGDNCTGIEQEPSDDFGDAAAWLNVLAEMQSDFRSQTGEDANDVKFFKGTKMTCSKAPGRNCCGTGGVFGGTCPESAAILRDKITAGATHYVGVTCQQKVLGACVKKRYHYCTYNSKFGRVFIEEYRKQSGDSWGPGPNAADCGYVTVEDIASVEMDEMDFSPVYGDVMESLDLPTGDRIQDFFDDRFPSADADVSDAFEELGQ